MLFQYVNQGGDARSENCVKHIFLQHKNIVSINKINRDIKWQPAGEEIKTREYRSLKSLYVINLITPYVQAAVQQTLNYVTRRGHSHRPDTPASGVCGISSII